MPRVAVVIPVLALLGLLATGPARAQEVNAVNAPTNLHTTGIWTTRLDLAWNDQSNNEDGFRVALSLDGTNFDNAGETAANVQSFRVTCLLPSTRYWFKVRAFRNTSTGREYSNYTATISPITDALAAPANTRADNIWSQTVDVAWDDVVPNETGFRIAMSSDGANFNNVGVTGPDVHVFRVTGLSPSTPYWFKVRSYLDDCGTTYYSAYDNTLALTTRALPAPTNLQVDPAFGVRPTAVALQWSDTPAYEDGFRIARSTDGVNYDNVYDGLATFATLCDLQPGTPYWFKVRAYLTTPSGVEYSDYSNIVGFQTPPLSLAAPNLVAASIVGASWVRLLYSDAAQGDQAIEFSVSESGGPWNVSSTVLPGSGAILFDRLMPGRHYDFRARCSYFNCAAGWQYSGWSNVLGVTTQLPSCPPDFGLAAEADPAKSPVNPLDQPWCLPPAEHGNEDPGIEALPVCATGQCDDPLTRDATPIAPKRIPLIIHIMRSSTGSAFVTAADVERLVYKMNMDFAEAGFMFTTQAVRTHDDDRYWSVSSLSQITDMKNAFAETPATALNVFISAFDPAGGSDPDLYRGTLLGIAGKFPWQSNPLDAQGGLWLNCSVVNDQSTVASHEVGHCLGLWHTFNGVDEVPACSVCYEFVDRTQADIRGDMCSDTRSTPRNYGCTNPTGADCNGTPWGATPVDNIMGYSHGCRSLFTPQQIRRMHCWTAARLPSLIQSAASAEQPVAFTEWSIRVTESSAARVVIACSLPSQADPEVSIFDLLGRRVASWHLGTVAPGRREVVWTPRDGQGGAVPSGVYLARLAANGVTRNTKFVLAK